MSAPPSPNGSNGQRDTGGRFKTGNRGGPGNPYGQQVARFRSLLLEAVTDEDFREIVEVLVKQAKGGEIVAAREILNRLAGKPAGTLDTDRLKLDKARLDLREREVEMAEDQAGF